MPSLKTIRKRITSVKATQKITRAMKMVAGARLNRAQQRITSLRPYAVKTQEILEGVKDEASLGDASRRLESLAQKMLDTNKKAEGHKLSAEDAENLQRENRKESAAALQRYNDAAKKVRAIPGGEAMLVRFQRLAMRTF